MSNKLEHTFADTDVTVSDDQVMSVNYIWLVVKNENIVIKKHDVIALAKYFNLSETDL